MAAAFGLTIRSAFRWNSEHLRYVGFGIVALVDTFFRMWSAWELTARRRVSVTACNCNQIRGPVSFVPTTSLIAPSNLAALLAQAPQQWSLAASPRTMRTHSRAIPLSCSFIRDCIIHDVSSTRYFSYILQ